MSELATRIKGALDEYGPVPVDDEHIDGYFHATQSEFVDAVVELLDSGACHTMINNNRVLYLIK